MNPIAPSNLADESPNNEVGASDNRLSLNPTDDRWKAVLEKWQDGQTYEATVKITQNAPGEFEVTSLQSESETPAESGAGDESEPANSASSYPNPAIAGMM